MHIPACWWFLYLMTPAPQPESPTQQVHDLVTTRVQPSLRCNEHINTLKRWELGDAKLAKPGEYWKFNLGWPSV